MIASWMERARCAKPENRALFWSIEDEFEDELTTPSQRKALKKQGQSICSECPVQLECWNYSRSVRPIMGMWAGKYYSDRHQIRAAS
jgi:Transcription factor WhiB